MKHWPENNLLPSEVTKCGLPISTVAIGDDFYDFDCPECGEIAVREMVRDTAHIRAAFRTTLLGEGQ